MLSRLKQLLLPHRLKWRDPRKDQVFTWEQRKELVQFCLDNPLAVFDEQNGGGRVLLVGDFILKGLGANLGQYSDYKFPISYLIERQKYSAGIYENRADAFGCGGVNNV